MNNKVIKFFLIIILGLNIVFRIPSLFDPVSYGDECIYLTLGQAFRKGLVFYRDIHDNKPPLLYIVAGLTGATQFWFRFITIIWNSVNVWLIYKLANKLIKNKTAGLIAGFLFAIFSLLPEGRIANGEIFMIMPATLGILLALEAENKKKALLWFVSGLCFSMAFLFKIPIAFDFAGLVLAFFVFNPSNGVFRKNKLKEIFAFLFNKNFYLIILGFSLPILASIFYYGLKGAFTPYVRSALMQNIGYLSSWSGSNLGLYQRMIIVFIISLLIFVIRKRLGFSFFLPALMTLFGLFGIFLSERPYPHYLIEIAPWAALLLTALFVQKKLSQLIITTLIICITLAGVIKFKYWWYPNIPYYKNFAKLAFGKIDKNEYFKYFGDKVLNDYKVSDYLLKNASEDERVFIWGDGACIYALSKRLPPGRYSVNYHIYDFNGFDETIKAVEKNQPVFIIKLASSEKEFPQLDLELTRSYVPAIQIGEAKIYKRIY